MLAELRAVERAHMKVTRARAAHDQARGELELAIRAAIGSGRSLREVANVSGVSRERVRQIASRADETP